MEFVFINNSDKAFQVEDVAYKVLIATKSCVLYYMGQKIYYVLTSLNRVDSDTEILAALTSVKS